MVEVAHSSVVTVWGEYSAALHCSAHGEPRPSITWARRRSAFRYLELECQFRIYTHKKGLNITIIIMIIIMTE